MGFGFPGCDSSKTLVRLSWNGFFPECGFSEMLMRRGGGFPGCDFGEIFLGLSWYFLGTNVFRGVTLMWLA